MKIYNSKKYTTDVLVLEHSDFDNWDYVLRHLPFQRFEYIFTPRDLTEEQINNLKFTISVCEKYFGKIYKYEEMCSNT